MNQLAGKRVLITGGLGFIGSNLARRLLALDARVTVLDCSLEGSGANAANLQGIAGAVRRFDADLRTGEGLDAALSGCAAVFHLAAQTGHLDSMRDPVRDLSINALGTLALLEACRRVAPTAPFVFASTRQLYGPPQSLPVSESHPLQPPDINAIGKLCGEEMLKVYARIHALPTVCLRLTNVYGPGMRIVDARQMFLGLWIRQVLQGEPVKVFGDGTQRRDLAFVGDVVEALLRAADPALRGQVFNVGSDESIELRALAAALCALGDGRSQPELVPFPPERKVIDIGDYVGDYGAIERATGWRATTRLTAGLATTLAYYRANLQAYLEIR